MLYALHVGADSVLIEALSADSFERNQHTYKFVNHIFKSRVLIVSIQNTNSVYSFFETT